MTAAVTLSRETVDVTFFGQLYSARYVTLQKFDELTGYSPDAVHAKIRSGKWLENHVWKKADDGRILVDLVGYALWVEGGTACPPQPIRR